MVFDNIVLVVILVFINLRYIYIYIDQYSNRCPIVGILYTIHISVLYQL